MIHSFHTKEDNILTQRPMLEQTFSVNSTRSPDEWPRSARARPFENRKQTLGLGTKCRVTRLILYAVAPGESIRPRRTAHSVKLKLMARRLLHHMLISRRGRFFSQLNHTYLPKKSTQQGRTRCLGPGRAFTQARKPQPSSLPPN